MDIKIAASILNADANNLEKEISSVSASADWIHVDVMDNHFVPNLTMGPLVCEALRNYGITAVLDVHLMIEPVDAIVPVFAKAGATYITFHPEATPNVQDTLNLIHDQGCKAGLVLNPDTDLEHLVPVLHQLDSIMLMSVYPGFGAQTFIPRVLEKLQRVRHLLDQEKIDIPLEIDGGVKINNIREIAAHGANTFVAGSAIFGSQNFAETIAALRRAAH